MMIWNIDGNPATRNLIFAIDGLIFVLLAIYSVIWCKVRFKRPLFKPLEISEVMAMEHPLYLVAHRQKQQKEEE